MASIGLKVIRGVFGAAEHIAPRLTGRAAFELFCRTPNAKALTDGERRAVDRAAEFMAEARHHRLKTATGCVMVHEFRPEPGRAVAGTVLVVHGWRSRTEYMRALIEGYRAAGYRVASLDLPGHGQSRGRRLNMVNAVDLFELFAEIAGLDVHAVVPPSHILDCEPMLPYLTNAAAGPIRQYNFSQLGGAVPPNAHTWPSVFTIAGQKVGNDILFDDQATCEESGGEWFGPGAAVVYSNCCDVRAFVYTNLVIQPTSVWTVRNDRYKLVKSQLSSCDADVNPYELYDLKPTLLNPDGLDNSPFNLLASGNPLTPDQESNLNQLMAVLASLLASEPACTGDGNQDKTVNVDDIDGLVADWGLPSVFDFNNDGVTDQTDLQTLLNNYGDVCFTPAQSPVPLTINLAGGQVMLQWPNPSVPGQLEAIPQLSGTNQWSPVGNLPFAIGYSNTVFMTTSNQATFFRVHQ